MSELPTGTITFLFTDVEGSTRLWEQHPRAMRAVMARHDRLLTEVFEQHDGMVVRPRGEGDSLFAVFVRASDAVAAALAGQRALLAEDWGEVGPLRVRMGLHTGEADLREGDYYGSAVNRCARIRAAGHGGQILLSHATAQLVRSALPAGSGLLDLGRHRLRDLAEGEQLFQIAAPGFPDVFPPLRTLDARPHNLPLQLTSFVGREQEATALAALLGQHRLVTLTGPGGTGKTRLALQVAAERLAAYADGVFFVDLAPLADPALVPSAVAQALGVAAFTELSIRESVLRFLRDKQLLLVLDNYEHLLAAAEFAGALVQAAPLVSLLVTSRAPLRVRGEREYPLAPLPVPAEMLASPAALAENPAVALFVQRARDVRPAFALSGDNAATVAAICARLDGLPLAIELAAARVRVLSVAALLTRLAQRLPVLTGGARDVPARQQTLRDAIAWSYDLLRPAEQRLFRRLGVFAGGCTLELAEAVCNADGDLGLDVLDGVSSLVEKSLLRQADGLAGEPRYRMLETLREFALGELEASGEAETVRRHFAVQVLQLARHAAAVNDWAQLDAEFDNIRAVLGWCVERAELALGVRLYWTLGVYLLYRGASPEGEVWCQRLLALPEAAQPSVLRARLLAHGRLELYAPGEQDRIVAGLEEAIALSRRFGDTRCLVNALASLVRLRLDQSNFDAAVSLGEEALSLALEARAFETTAHLQTFLFQAAMFCGDLAAAEELIAANRALVATAGRTSSVQRIFSLMSEAQLAEAHGDAVQARGFWEAALHEAAAEQTENSPVRMNGLVRFAQFLLRQGDTRAAVAGCAESLAVQHRWGPYHHLYTTLHVLAQAAERCGLPAMSACLLAAIDDKKRRESLSEIFLSHADYHAAVARARAELDEAAFAAAWAAGAALSADDAIEYGLKVVAQLQQVLATETDAAGQGT